MKVEVGPYVKSLGPATATADVKIIEIDKQNGEDFDERTLNAMTRWLIDENQWFFDVMDFDGHQTFRVVYNFEWNGEVKSVMAFPVFTKNFHIHG